MQTIEYLCSLMGTLEKLINTLVPICFSDEPQGTGRLYSSTLGSTKGTRLSGQYNHWIPIQSHVKPMLNYLCFTYVSISRGGEGTGKQVKTGENMGHY